MAISQAENFLEGLLQEEQQHGQETQRDPEATIN